MTNLRAGIPLSYVIYVSVRRDVTLPVLEVTTFSQSTDHFLLQMSMKTAKGWIDIGKADLADGFLEIAMNVSSFLVLVPLYTPICDFHG